MNRMRTVIRATCFVSAAALLACGSSGSSSDDGAGASPSGAGSGVAGGSQAGATASAGSSAGGTANVAGGFSAGGTFSAAGSVSTGGTFSAAGTGGTGGSFSVAGSAGTGGSSTGGSAGSTGGGGAGGTVGGAGAGGAGGSGGTPASTITCIDGTCLNPDCKPYTTAQPIDEFPGTGFDAKPTYMPNDVIIPTLDDVPDDLVDPPDTANGSGGWTTKDLAWLDSHHMHWDFFINTDNACDLVDPGAPQGCTDAVTDILKNHYPGNHTIHHYHLGTPGADGCGDAACVKTELQGVETFINTFSKGARPHLTRFRAPFGEPYQEGVGAPGYDFVPPAVVPFAVSVGWSIDSDDSNHDDGTNCVDANGKKAACPTGTITAGVVEKLIKTPGKGAYGIVLMHGLFGWTHDAIPLLFDPITGYLVKNKFRVGTLEDAICWKYGKHSWEIVQSKNGTARSPN